MFSKNKFKVTITLFFAIFSFSFAGFAQSSSKFIVVLDAGHGGKDDGAKYNGNKEKDLTLAVTLKVGKLLEQNPSVDLIYTRKTDEFIELRERAKIANRANANLFVSIHCNANKSSTPNGSETYVMGMSRANMNFEVSKAENSVIFLEDNYKKAYKGFDPNNPETLIGLKMVQENNLTSSIDLANKIQNNFSNSSAIKSRGIKQEPLWVLDASIMPGVLIEIGFVSSPIDVVFLESENGQNDIAKSIADAIVSYKNEYFGDGGAEFLEEKPSQNVIENKIKVNDSSQINTPIIIKDTLGSIYKVQLSASKKKIALESKNFKGLKNVSMLYEDQIYKYFFGETTDYMEAKNQLKEAKSKGYDSAFLIAYKNGKKISIQEAIK
ncbi:N-acetylmuramoyl-L-alanine amidase [Flavobacterium sp. ZT3R18]|uniref:N-acetylmuramoyl-L-alanine amidase family protein n=1 Tax=Flavobacterium sp. ZT3R18 TaxID=2594429 RepID=UPI00117AADAF|nr:N-acetylmuramoyl-L-alanine amidase [Flavobacterium sp. ZT3R18]TRX35149.1 N-acetylmuramoyl-L-alanine amidase [Flavobacterium sp. ZT3R18]